MESRAGLGFQYVANTCFSQFRVIYFKGYLALVCPNFHFLNFEFRILTSKIHHSALRRFAAHGGMGIRTPDIQLAKLALYQLSYTPLCLRRRGIMERKRSSCALRAISGCADFFDIIFRSGVRRLPASQASLESAFPLSGSQLFPQGTFDLSQGP